MLCIAREIKSQKVRHINRVVGTAAYSRSRGCNVFIHTYIQIKVKKL